MHSSDQFDDLGFRMATLADTSLPVPVPALSARDLLVLLFVLVSVGTVVLRPGRGS